MVMVGEAKTTDKEGIGSLRGGSPESQAEGFWAALSRDICEGGWKAGLG